MQKLLIFSIILLCIASPLFSQVTVSYEMESTLYIQSSLPVPFAPNHFGAHLGTLTFQRTAGDTTPLYDPSLIAINTNNTWQIKGPYSWGSNANGPVYTESYINLYPHSVYLMGTPKSLQLKRLSPNAGKVPLTNMGSSGINESLFVVDLYVVNTDSNYSGSKLKPNATYEIIPGAIGTFTVALAAPGKTIWDSGIINLPLLVDGIPYTQTQPFLGNSTGNVEFHPEQYLFKILNNSPFSIDEVLTNGQAFVARFQLNISKVNTQNVGMTYGVYVSFDNNSKTFPFSMHREDNAGNSVIPYSLKFLGDKVKRDDPMLWDGFQGNGTYYQNLYVTDIYSSAVDSVPDGIYTDTITVTITPKDHI